MYTVTPDCCNESVQTLSICMACAKISSGDELLKNQNSSMDGFHGFTSGGQELGSAAVQASKHYVGSLPLVLKDGRSCFSQGESSLYSCLLITHLPSGSRTLIL